MFFRHSKNPLLQKSPNTVFLLIVKPPSDAKRKLQQDFIQNALPKAFELLKPGHSMYIRTPLIDESLIKKLSPRLIFVFVVWLVFLRLPTHHPTKKLGPTLRPSLKERKENVPYDTKKSLFTGS